jgi:PAS domain S-box-containing protein
MTMSAISRVGEPKQASAGAQDRLAVGEVEVKELADLTFALDQHAIVAVTNIQGTVTRVNDKFCAISQYSKDELIGQNHRILNSGYHAKEFFVQMYQTIANGKVWHGEIKNRAKDGSTYWVDTTIVPTLNAGGEPHQYLAIGADISARKRFEETRERLAAVVEHSDDAIISKTLDGMINAWNRGAEKVFGYSASEMIGKPMVILLPPDRLNEESDILTRIRRGESVDHFETVRVRKDGRKIDISVTISPIRDASGAIVGASKIARDITERRLAEESRREAVLKELTDQKFALDQHARVSITDIEGTITYVNDTFCDISKFSRQELIGHNHRIVKSGRHSKEFFQQMYHTITNGTVWRGEIENRAKDGSTYWIEAAIVPFIGKDGKPLQYVAIGTDITTRKTAEAHLAQMEGKYRGLLEAAPDAMVVVNATGEIVLLNAQAEKQFGYSRDELVGQQVKNIIPDGFAERLIADGLRSREDALAQQIGTGTELIARRKDGSQFPIEIMLRPMESAEGILVTAAIRDITARKTAETHLLYKVAQLNRSNEELGQFTNIASHDLQEPLRMVASYVQLLAKRYEGQLDADADEFIAIAVGGCKRMQALIRDLLAYSRVGANEQSRHETITEHALKEALENLGAAIKDAGAEVTHDALPSITTNHAQLVQVFQNLIDNAIKYRSATKPRIHVSAATNGSNEWTFAVRDNGIGIAPQYFERIFLLFQRLHGREEFEGTGIGLAICKKIVDRQGGRIWIESQPGEGSTFYFTLPSVALAQTSH